MDRLQCLLLEFRRDRSAPAMEEIVRATRPRLLAAARRIVPREDAEDAVQAAYHALLARPEAPSVAVLPWLLAAVVRIAYRRKAVQRREIGIAERLARPASPVEEASRAETRALVRREVARLPAPYRDPVVLYHLECLSVTEVARLLDVPASTVTTRLQRARLLLKARLSPALLHSVMVVPWFLQDLARSLAVPIGGIMKLKTAVLVGGVAFATGAIGLGAGLTHRDPEVTRSATRTEAPRRDAEVAELRQRLAELEGIKGGAGGEGEAFAPGPPVASEPAAGALRVGVSAAFAMAELRKKHVLDLEKSKAAAERLGVPPHSLEVARRAYLCVVNQADPASQKEALDALRDVGEGRMAAVTALLYGAEEGPVGTDWLEVLLGVARFDGQEHRIVELLKDAESPAWAKRAVIQQADAVDAEVVRGYLLDRLAREEDRYMWSSIAMSLGRMREPRAVAACEETLRRGGDWRPFEIYALHALGEIGDFAAEAALLAYLDGGKPAHPFDGLRALGKIDAQKARARAGMLGEAARTRLLEELAR